MKNYIKIFLLLVFFSDIANAVETNKKSSSSLVQYSYEGNILNILALIERDCQNGDIKKINVAANRLREYLAWYYANSKTKPHNEKYLESEITYQGVKVIEIKYGGLLYSGSIFLPLTNSNKPLQIELLKANAMLSSFVDNEIISARVGYISYDFNNQDAISDFNKLFLAVQKSDFEQIKKNIANIYTNSLVNQSHRMSFVSKIRDNLALARYLFIKQEKAAEDLAQYAESIMNQLADFDHKNSIQQEEIKALQLELEEDNSKAANPAYLLKWEKIPLESKEQWGQ